MTAGDGLEIGAKGLRAFDALRDGDALDAAPFLLDLWKYVPTREIKGTFVPKEIRPMYSPNGHITLGAFPPEWLTRTIGKAQKIAGKVADVAEKVRPYTVPPPPMTGVAPVAQPVQYQPERPAIPGWVIPAAGALAVFALLKWRRVI